MLRRLLFLGLLAFLLLIGACAPPPTPTEPPTRTLAPLPRNTVTPTPSLTPTEFGATPIPSSSPTPTLPTPIPPTVAPTYTFGDIPSMERRLYDTPIFQNLSGERVRQIFAA